MKLCDECNAVAPGSRCPECGTPTEKAPSWRPRGGETSYERMRRITRGAPVANYPDGRPVLFTP